VATSLCFDSSELSNKVARYERADTILPRRGHSRGIAVTRALALLCRGCGMLASPRMFGGLDFAFLAVYLVITMVIGFAVGRREKALSGLLPGRQHAALVRRRNFNHCSRHQFRTVRGRDGLCLQ